MRAVLLSAFGPPSALVATDLAEPVAGPGQALIEVGFASITFVETQVRAGQPPNPAMMPRLPLIPGNGVGGRVIAVGSGVDRQLLGTLVVSTTGGSGGYAERVEGSGTLFLTFDGLREAKVRNRDTCVRIGPAAARL